VAAHALKGLDRTPSLHPGDIFQEAEASWKVEAAVYSPRRGYSGCHLPGIKRHSILNRPSGVMTIEYLVVMVSSSHQQQKPEFS
jgi:hypothetical protein